MLYNMLGSAEKTGLGHRVRTASNNVNGLLNLRQQKLAVPAQNPQGVKADLNLIKHVQLWTLAEENRYGLCEHFTAGSLALLL